MANIRHFIDGCLLSMLNGAIINGIISIKNNECVCVCVARWWKSFSIFRTYTRKVSHVNAGVEQNQNHFHMICWNIVLIEFHTNDVRSNLSIIMFMMKLAWGQIQLSYNRWRFAEHHVRLLPISNWVGFEACNEIIIHQVQCGNNWESDEKNANLSIWWAFEPAPMLF